MSKEPDNDNEEMLKNVKNEKFFLGKWSFFFLKLMSKFKTLEISVARYCKAFTGSMLIKK